MPYSVRSRKRTNRRKSQSLQKPNGVISRRVQKVGGEKFAIVCADLVVTRRRQHRSYRTRLGTYGRGGVEEPAHAWTFQAREPGDPMSFQRAVARWNGRKTPQAVQPTCTCVGSQMSP